MSTNKDKKKTKFVFQPEYPGGPKELTKFLYQNLQYPALAAELNVEGTVLVEYDIDYQGNVVATRVLQGLGHGCDEEASRLVRLLKFSVAKNRGLHVLFHQKARIQFKKPKAVPIPETPSNPAGDMQVSYQVVPSAPAEAQTPETKPAVVYSYTINL